MEQFEREVLDRLVRLESKIDTYSEVKGIVYDNAHRIDKLEIYVREKSEVIFLNENNISDIEKKIIELTDNIEDVGMLLKKQQDDNKWTRRTLLGAVITTLVGVGATIIRFWLGI